MGWPSPGDYNGAIQTPQAAFRDPKRRDCAVELMPSKSMPLPWARTGANAMEQRMIARAVKRARYMGLLPYVSAAM